MVASLPVTPVPAVAGPFTGGQYVVHEPLHFEVVGVSGANQYKVKPLLLVSTVAPPMLAVFRLPAAGAAWPLLPPEEPPEEVPDELHPTTSAAAAAAAGSANSIHGRRLRAFSVTYRLAAWTKPLPQPTQRELRPA